MSSLRWGPAFRLARREVRRHPWRHLLVVGLVFVPVLAVFTTFSALDTWQVNDARKAEFRYAGKSGGFGQEVETLDGSVSIDGVAVPVPVERLPEGTDVEHSWQGADWFVLDHDLPGGAGPALAGAVVLDVPEGTRRAARVVVERGRLPRSDDEVLLSPVLAEAGGWGLGDEVESARTARRFTVVGIGRAGDRRETSMAAVADQPDRYWTAHLAASSVLETPNLEVLSLDAQQETSVWLPDGVDPEILNALGGVPAGELESLDTRIGPGIVLGSTAICAIAAVVASAAFALGSRKQLRSVGLLSTIGADPAAIRAALVLQGALPGLLAGVLAVVVGAIGAAVANRLGLVERGTQIEGARAHLSLGGAVLSVLLGTFAGVVAAWQPASAASRVPVLSALGGRKPAPPVSPKLPIGGLALWTVGVIGIAVGSRAQRYEETSALAEIAPFVLIIAVAALAFGGVAIAPLLVALLGRATSSLRGSLRLVGRGLVRQRTSSAAAVAAIAVALAMPVGLLTTRAVDARTTATLNGKPVPESDLLLSEEVEPVGVRSLFATKDQTVVSIDGDLGSTTAASLEEGATTILGPEAERIQTLALADGGGRYRYVTALPPTTTSLLEPWAADALEAGAAVPFGFDPSTSRDVDPATLIGVDDITLRSGEDELPLALVQPPDDAVWTFASLSAGILVSTTTLGDFGSGRPLSGVAFVRPGAPSLAEATSINALDAYGFHGTRRPTLAQIRSAPDAPDLGDGNTSTAWLSLTDDPRAFEDQGYVDEEDRPDRALLILAGVSTALSLVVLTIALALRSYDGMEDERAALAAGAPPHRIRRLRALEGVALAGLGALLAIPLGWLPVMGVQLGQVRTAGYADQFLDQLAWPGLALVPTLLAPMVVVAIGWTVVPALGAWFRAARGGAKDLVVPRW